MPFAFTGEASDVVIMVRFWGMVESIFRELLRRDVLVRPILVGRFSRTRCVVRCGDADELFRYFWWWDSWRGRLRWYQAEGALWFLDCGGVSYNREVIGVTSVLRWLFRLIHVAETPPNMEAHVAISIARSQGQETYCINVYGINEECSSIS
jgi:hypothetical protein